MANTYTLYLKTHNFHWNVTGPTFGTLHALFEQQYTELALAVDEVAERIRTLGAPVPGSYTAFARLASVAEANGAPTAQDMIRQLADDQDIVARTAKALFPMVEVAHDAPTTDLLTRRIRIHEKNAWMLRALLA